MKKIIILLFSIILIIILFRIFNVQNKISKQLYPTTYSEHVEKYAKEYDLDPLLIYAIIKTESNFANNAKSSSGAYGLMQVMEETAKDMAKILKIEITEVELLYEPETNIRIGTAYFATLLEKYDYNNNLALIAYNAGFGNVNKWIQDGTIKEDGSDIENVPFKETNSYVRKILRDYNIYKDLYQK